MFAQASDKIGRFGPSRSVVCAGRGMVATSQPQAAYEAVRVLADGGNAVDAAVTASILLGVLEPMQIGLGGDLMALVYHGSNRTLHALNASGRSAASATRTAVIGALGETAAQIPPHSVHAVTVPGAVDGWLTLLEKFGVIDRARAFAPAIAAAADGFAVAPQTAATWAMGAPLLVKNPASAVTWLNDGKAPGAGARFRNPNLAHSLRQISDGGRDAFYHGAIAERIVAAVEALGGFLTTDDFARHTCQWVEPLYASYRGYRLAQMPPNTHGVAVLEAMAILDRLEWQAHGFGAAAVAHAQIEAVKAAMTDAQAQVADSDHMMVKPDWFLDPARIAGYAAAIGAPAGDAALSRGGGDTAFVCVADHMGNFAAVIASLFVPWATGITAGDTGILLQNRGAGFSLDPAHPNVIAPGKRPRHTILPALLLAGDDPLMAFGFVGGDMQVQAQVQFLCNLIDFQMSPQEALDAPRWRYEGQGRKVALEPALATAVGPTLAAWGHELVGDVGFFGGGQAVLRHPDHGMFQGASDSRRDGCALGL